MSNFLKVTIAAATALAISACSSKQPVIQPDYKEVKTYTSQSELLLVYTKSDVDPSIPLDKKDKRWERTKTDTDVLNVFDKEGSPAIVYKKKIKLNEGETTNIEEINKIDLVLKENRQNIFTSNKVELSVKERKAEDKNVSVNIDYKIDLISEVKTDLVNMKKYPNYQTLKANDSYEVKRGKYQVLSKLVLKDNSNIFVVYKSNLK